MESPFQPKWKVHFNPNGKSIMESPFRPKWKVHNGKSISTQMESPFAPKWKVHLCQNGQQSNYTSHILYQFSACRPEGGALRPSARLLEFADLAGGCSALLYKGTHSLVYRCFDLSFHFDRSFHRFLQPTLRISDFLALSLPVDRVPHP